MSTRKICAAAQKAIMIGGMCSLSYLAVYLARNILGTVSPQMIEEGFFTTEQIGSLSSTFFITYAFGQLINGAIGDKIKAKYMISLGLIFAGICNMLFAVLSQHMIIASISYGSIGFFLSMIYGPMTKVVAENTEPIYATRCSLGYTFASFFGSPLAGILASILAWRLVFAAGSSLLLLMGVICFVCFTLFEKKGFIKYNQYQPVSHQGGGIGILLKHHIVKFTFISIVTGVIRTTVVFWLPTYLSQHLGFSSDVSALIFTAATLFISFAPFLAVFVYELLGHNMELTIFLAFISSAFCFFMVYLCSQPVLNIIFMILAILTCNCASSMMWSRYCPSLRDTGMVSSATGFLDFASYMAASISSTIFANSVAAIGWGNLIFIWFALMVVGIVVSIPFTKRK